MGGSVVIRFRLGRRPREESVADNYKNLEQFVEQLWNRIR